MADVEVNFDMLDAVNRKEADTLVAELRKAGARASIAAEHPPASGFVALGTLVAVVTLSVGSTAALSIVAAFIYRVFRRGIVLDLTRARPSIRKANDLPRGSVLIIYADGKQELREGVPGEKIGDLLKTVLENFRPPALDGGAADEGDVSKKPALSRATKRK